MNNIRKQARNAVTKLRPRKNSPLYESNGRGDNRNATNGGGVNDATLGSGNLRMAVMLPEGEDECEWIAFNISDFYKQISMLYGTVLPHCTKQTCPVMNAGRNYIYSWPEGRGKTVSLSAPQYIDKLMTWILVNSVSTVFQIFKTIFFQESMEDDTIFPSKLDVPFPANFKDISRQMIRRLFRVYAHIYIQHMPQIRHLNEEAHLNTSFKHFIFFVQEFQEIEL